MLRRRWVKALVWLLCLIPVGYLGWRGYHQDLSANPVEFVTRYTGDWTLRFLVITLAVTPLRKLLGLPDLIKFRRLIGLFTFLYGCMHFTTYLWLDKYLDPDPMWPNIVHDIAKRPFITAGFTAFVLMIPLALTSTTGWIRRLGGKRWQLLHRLVYISAIAGVVHYYWLIKSAVQRPIFYGCLVLLALMIRAWYWARSKRSRTAASTAIPAVR
jgi:methionine sulfoxide reductase heme-binding subunit